jgi:hypothetical protein
VQDENGYYGLGVLTGDFDDDGLIDIFVANDSTPNFHYRNKGDGTFEEIGLARARRSTRNGSEQGSMGVTCGRLRSRRQARYLHHNFADEYNTLYHNDGKNSFTDLSYAAKVAAVSLPHVGWGTKFFDYDNDGWVDLFVANGHVYPQLPAIASRDCCTETIATRRSLKSRRSLAQSDENRVESRRGVWRYR